MSVSAQTAYLFVEVDEFVVREFEWLDGLQHRIPVAIVDVWYETVHGIYRVQRNAALLLYKVKQMPG